MTLLKHNWTEVRDRAFWREEPLNRPPVIFETIGAWRHPMYNGAGYDYTKYGEDIAAFGRDFRAVWEARAAVPDDTVPCIAPQMGGAIEAVLLAGDIEWGPELSMLNYWYPGTGFWFSENDAVMLSPEMYRELFLDLEVRLCAGVETAVCAYTATVRATVVNASTAARSFQAEARFTTCGPAWAYPALPSTEIALQPGERREIAFEPAPWIAGKASWWWPNVPYRPGYRTQLHWAEVALRDGSERLHGARVRFGFRECSQVGDHFEINGVRVNFRGDNLQVANHVELYEAIKGLDATRPIFEDFLAANRASFNPEEIFVPLLDKPDFTWIEHYLSFDAQNQPFFTTIEHNDAVVPLRGRPYGIGEADWMRSSTPAGLVWFAATIALARSQGAADARPYVLLSSWASIVPGVKYTDFLTEENRHPVYGEDNLPDPWSHPGIRRLQQACHPLLALDVAFWQLNRHSDAHGHFPIHAPRITALERVERTISVFNDEFSGGDLTLRWEVREGSPTNRSWETGAVALAIPPGKMGVVIAFTEPKFNTKGNNHEHTTIHPLFSARLASVSRAHAADVRDEA